MTLLKKAENRRIGNKPFSVKKAILLASSLELTKEVGESARWTGTEIKDRQLRLAKLAVTVWPR
jgi:hypothetical protein